MNVYFEDSIEYVNEKFYNKLDINENVGSSTTQDLYQPNLEISESNVNMFPVKYDPAVKKLYHSNEYVTINTCKPLEYKNYLDWFNKKILW